MSRSRLRPTVEATTTRRRTRWQGSQAERFGTVIVGGGQAGLATGYHLAKHDPSFVILDAGERIGDPWRKRWDSLRLYSPASYDGLPGMRFPARRASFPTTHEMADYLEAYAARFELPVRTSTAVETLRKDGDRYVVTAGAQTFEADSVVVATGVMQKPVRPDLRTGARPAHHATPLERLPQPLAATGGACLGGRREPLGSRHRLRGGCRARDDPVGKRHRPDPCVGRDSARAARLPRSVLRRLARADDGHAARPQDASAHPARRCAAAAVPEEGSARRWSRARRARVPWACRTVCPCSTTAASSTCGT